VTNAELVPGLAVEVLPGLRRLLAPNPSAMTGPGTNTYLVGAPDTVVVDPGPDDPVHLDAVVEAGAARIRYVLVTHTHPDHAPGAAALAARTGATLLGFGARGGFVPDGELADGDIVAVPGARLTALHTPGHAPDHLCFLFEPEVDTSPDGVPSRVLLSGDHVMGGSTVAIAPPDGDMAAYLTSLRRLLRLDPPIDAIAPGHGPLIVEARAVLEGYVSHRLARERSVLEALGRLGPASPDELVDAVYGHLLPSLRWAASATLWAHLRKLGAEGRAVGDDPDGRGARWRLAGS